MSIYDYSWSNKDMERMFEEGAYINDCKVVGEYYWTHVSSTGEELVLFCIDKYHAESYKEPLDSDIYTSLDIALSRTSGFIVVVKRYVDESGMSTYSSEYDSVVPYKGSYSSNLWDEIKYALNTRHTLPPHLRSH